MFKNIVAILGTWLGLLYSFLSYGQIIIQPEAIQKITREDTAYIYSLLRKARGILSTNPDSALVLSKTAREKSHEKNYPEGIARSLLYIGEIYLKQDNLVQSAYYINQAIPYAINALSGRDQLIALWHCMKSEVYTKNTHLDSAVYHLHAAEKIASEIGDKHIMYFTYKNLGGIWSINGQKEKAALYLQKAENMISGIQDTISQKTRYADLYIKYIGLYRQKADTALLYHYAEKLLHTGEELSNNKVITNAYCALINYYHLLNMPEQSMVYAKKALNICDTNDLNSLYFAQWGMSLGYANLRHFKEAQKFGLAALETAKKHFARPNQTLTNLYRHLAKVHYELGETGAAYQYHVQYANLSDSLNNAERTHAIDKLEAQYQAARKDKEIISNQLLISEQKNKLTRTNMWLLGISLSGGLLLILVWVYFAGRRRKEKNTHEIERLRSLIEGEEKERSRLSSELHDGVASQINAVKLHVAALRQHDQTDKKNLLIEEIGLMLEETSGEVRRIAYNLTSEELMFNGLAQSIQHFCNRALAHSDIAADVQIYDGADRIKPELALSIYRIVQELVQNILKHSGASQMTLMLYTDEHYVILLAEDNGSTGYHEFLRQEGTPGLGLHSIEERVSAHQGVCLMGGNAAGTGWVTEIKFPLSKLRHDANT